MSCRPILLPHHYPIVLVPYVPCLPISTNSDLMAVLPYPVAPPKNPQPVSGAKQEKKVSRHHIKLSVTVG